MKALVETTSNIMLIDPQTKEVLPDDRPAVVTWTQFFEARTGAGQIKIHQSGLPSDASDAEFLKFYKDSDKNTSLAIAAYLSTFETEAVVATDDTRKLLEEQAHALGVKFRSDISDEKLLDKIVAAEAAAKAEADK